MSELLNKWAAIDPPILRLLLVRPIGYQDDSDESCPSDIALKTSPQQVGSVGLMLAVKMCHTAKTTSGGIFQPFCDHTAFLVFPHECKPLFDPVTARVV
ncbi:hypothetical protein CSKR_111673 [Clonorchis sinensis]|uniref:Uncharacterized protein n=1 Tax=Clonorchis sinensis TaxID=79923 RepID=A0A419Q797_CLOSI|nr:hypothetical protein CSKR_111673 [Clonorchis sinensis]